MGCEKQREEEGRDIREKKRPETHLCAHGEISYCLDPTRDWESVRIRYRIFPHLVQFVSMFYFLPLFSHQSSDQI